MTPPRVFVTRRWPQAVERALTDRFDVQFNESDAPLSAAQLMAGMRAADAVCPTVTDRLPADVIGCVGGRARMIANYGVGFEHIDLDAARANNIVVSNTPDVLTDCTADLTMALLLAVTRRVAEGDRRLRAGAWSGWCPTDMLGTRVSGKALGLVGYGRIARAVARRAVLGFGMQVRVYSPRAIPVDASVPVTAVGSLEELLSSGDFVSLHCPSNAATRHLLDAARLRSMRSDAFLINTARGNIVDEAALVEALQRGVIAGAALDVYEFEPRIHPGLLALPNVVLLPHLGSATTETRIAMGMRVVRNLEAFFAGEAPPDRIA